MNPEKVLNSEPIKNEDFSWVITSTSLYFAKEVKSPNHNFNCIL